MKPAKGPSAAVSSSKPLPGKAPAKKPAAKPAPAKKPAAKPAPAKKPAAKPAPKAPAKAPAKKPAPKAVVPPPASVPEPPKAVVPPPPPKPKYPVVKPGDRKTSGNARKLRPIGATKFDEATLAEFRAKFTKDREEIDRQIRVIRDNALSPDTDENKEEDGSNTYNREAGLNRMGELQDKRKNILNALRAIEEKRYGICQVCGGLISRDRLRAYPYAIRCVDCKAEYERKVALDRQAAQQGE